MIKQHLKTTMVLGLALILSAAFLASCTGTEADPAEMQTLVVAGIGEAKGKPDTAIIQLGVTVSDVDLGVAIDKANATMREVTDVMRARGIPEEDIQTSFYNVWRHDIHDPQTGMPTGEGTHNVETSMAVTVRNIDDLSSTIDAGLTAGANNIMGINFRISDTSILETQARTMAIADARNRAQEIAMTMDMNLGKALSISEGGAIVPGPYSYGIRGEGIGMGGGGPASISPGQSTIVAQMNIVYELVP